MTPSELKAITLKKLEDLIDKYMDGAINDINFSDECDEAISDFIGDFGDM